MKRPKKKRKKKATNYTPCFQMFAQHMKRLVNRFGFGDQQSGLAASERGFFILIFGDSHQSDEEREKVLRKQRGQKRMQGILFSMGIWIA